MSRVTIELLVLLYYSDELFKEDIYKKQKAQIYKIDFV